MTNTTNATPVTDRVFAAMRADVMYCPTVEDMAAVILERGSVLPDAGAVWAVWHREDDGSLVLCEFDGCVCYTAHRTREAAVKAAAETNDCYRCEKYVAAIVPAGIACCLGDDMADTMRAGGGDFEWSAFMEGGFICLRVPAPNVSIAPAPASATPLSCHLIPTPSGRFTFAGRVPTDLAFAASNPDYVATALQCGPGIAQKQAAREGGTFRSLSWATEADAYAYAAGLGYAVPARPVYHPQTLSALRLYQGAAKARCRRIDDGDADADYAGAVDFATSEPGTRDPVEALRAYTRQRCGELLAKARAIRATMRNGHWQGDNGPLDLAAVQESLWQRREDRRAFLAAQARAAAGAPCEAADEVSEAGQVADTVTLPTAWASYLINGDASGLEDGEEARIAEHLDRELPADAAIVDVVEGSERFTWSYRLYGGDASGGDVADYTVLRPGARAAVQRAGATA